MYRGATIRKYERILVCMWVWDGGGGGRFKQ